MTDSTPSDDSAGPWLGKLPIAVTVDRSARLNLADLNDDLLRSARRPRGKRAVLAAARLVVMFCIGVAATLAWLPFGDAAREMIANASPQLGWLAPQSASVPAAQVVAPAPAAQPHDISPTEFDAVRERIDRITAGQEEMTHTIHDLTAAQDQVVQEIAKLREVEQYLLYKMAYKETEPRPAPTTQGHKPLRRPALAAAH
jgi:hypothetical protein